MISKEVNDSHKLFIIESCQSFDEEYYLQMNNDFHVSIILNIILNSFLTITATLGNGMIIVAILRSQNLQTPSYLLITSLAFADLLVGLLVHPLQTINYFFFWHKDIRAVCAMVNRFIFFFILLSVSSLMLVTCISIDRYLALTLRHRYPGIVTKKRVRFLIVAMWILSLVLALLSSMNSGYQTIYIVAFSICFALLSTTFIFYIKSFRTLHLYTVQVHAQQPNPLAGNFDVVRYKKTLKTMVVVLVCVVLCCVPLICTFGAYLVLGFQKEVVFFHNLSITLMCVNSSINPVIYLIRFADIRNACHQLFRNLVN